MNKTITILLTMFLVFSLTNPVFAETEGPVSGNFSTNVSPVTNGISVYDAGTTTLVAGLTPQQSYDIKVSITDNDGIGNLSKVTLKLWYDYGGTNSLLTNYDAITGSNDMLSQGITWDRSTGNSGSLYSLASNSSWGFPTYTAPGTAFMADAANTTFDFKFRVKVGKVARETTSGAKWHIGVFTEDQAGYSYYRAYTDSNIPGLPMDWYGEVVVDPVTVDWGNVPLGMQFDNEKAVQTLGKDANLKLVGVTYFANGVFAIGAKSSPTWTAGSSVMSITKKVSPTVKNTFALKAWYIALTNPLEGGTLLETEGIVADMATNQGQTDESGRGFFNNRLYLAISSSIDDPGTYTGTITYVIHNLD